MQSTTFTSFYTTAEKNAHSCHVDVKLCSDLLREIEITRALSRNVNENA